MRSLVLSFGLCFGLLSGSVRCVADSGASESDRTAIAIEALSRLKGMDLETKPSLKAAVMKVLDSTRGTTNFVTIVRDFQLQDQNVGLLEVAVKYPAEESGVEAMRLVLSSHELTQLNAFLQSTNAAVPKAIEAMGNTREKDIVPVLLPMVGNNQRDVSVRRQAVKSLALVQEGATGLLQLAQEDKLPNDVKFVATSELNQVRWPELKAKAAQVLPLPQGRNTESLPPVAELLKRTGDSAHGAEAFARQEVGCINCHRVKDKGVDLGPALTEIGDKLGKDALFEAILDPSAGIAFGYEAWQLELKNGDEAFGIIVSETAEEITIKDTKAIPTRIKKSEIAKRQQMKTSIMPAGLQQTMSTQELVDLVEYLSRLKKATH